ncbi:MAG: hypothetical protein J6O49_14470 [Bacteroidaceae bacterium]|nr:hypothetical protein [Bacteroidaceae bacterium]
MATNAEERKARIAAARQGSLRLMQMDANGTLDKLMEGRADEINNSLTSADANVTSASLMSSKREDRMNRMPTGRMGVAAANVPSVIRESFQNQPPVNENMTASSVLDDVFSLEDLQPQRKQQITEQVAPAQQTYSTGGGIDYPMIRTIVEDIVRKYAQSLNKKIISENTGGCAEINTIALGKTFKFLDSKGNIYEAKLSKIGNINEKKGIVK